MLNIASKRPDIHQAFMHYGNTTKIDPNDLRFHHYNLNKAAYDNALKSKWALNP